MKRPLYRAIASTVDAYRNCIKSGNQEWQERHMGVARELTDAYMPSGSGLDNGVKLSVADSTGERLVFYTSFHHMDESGGYDGWTEHTITVRASRSMVHTLEIKISGRNRNDIKDYLYEVFYDALTAEIDD